MWPSLSPLWRTEGVGALFDLRRGYYRLHPITSAPSNPEHYYRRRFWTMPAKENEAEHRRIQGPWWEAIYGDWLTVAASAFGAEDNRLSLLDVGAGFGAFVQAARARGWHAEGLEPSDYAREVAANEYGLNLMAEGWERANVRPGSLDLISALWVLEHLPEPEKFLEWCWVRLRVGGVLLIAVPHDFSPLQWRVTQRRAAGQPYYWINREHLSYWDWASLGNILGRAGFILRERLTLFPMETFLLRGEDYTTDPELGRRCHARVRAYDLSLTSGERLNLYRKLAARAMGRELVALAVKE